MTLYDWPLNMSFVGVGARTSWAMSEIVAPIGVESPAARTVPIVEAN